MRITVPFENGNANHSVQNGTEWNGLVAFTLHHGTVLERPKRLFLASGNGVLESKKYDAKKEVRKAKNSFSNAPSTSQQMALRMAVKSSDIPCEQSSSSTA